MLSYNEMQVTIGEITFNDFSSLSSFYLLRNTPEFLSTLSTRRTGSAKQGGHGIFDSLSFYGERILPFAGEIHATSQAARKTLEEDLKTTLALPAFQDYLTNDGYQLVLITDEDLSLKQCYAKVLDPPKFGLMDSGDPNCRSVTFTMIARDPILYSQTLHSASFTETYVATSCTVIQGVSPTVPFSLLQVGASMTTCANAGTIGSPPVITITGPADSPNIVNATTGRFMRFSGLTLGAGDSLIIDVAANTFLLDTGADASAYLTSDSDRWTLEPGNNSVYLIDDTPLSLNATALIEWRDTYI